MSIQLAIPAAFGKEKFEERTSKYNLISTDNIMGIFQENGWFPSKTQQVKSRTRSQDVVKHLITFRNENIPKVNDIIPEINLINSHDGSSTFRLMAGLYRFVCSNGLIVSESEFASFRIRHSSQAPDKIDSAIKEIVEIVPLITAKSEEMNTIIMNPVDRLDLSSNIIERVWENSGSKPFEPAQLIQARRDEDKENTLWNTYNSIQENLIKGGLIGTTSTNKKRKMRGITNIDKNIKINQILWEEASKFLQAA